MIMKFKILFFLILLPGLVFAQNQDWQVHKSTHFLVYYKQASEDLLSRLTQKVESYYEEITEDFGFNRFNFWTWDNRAKIYLFDNQDDYKSSNPNYTWSAGGVVVRNKTIQTYLTAPGLLDDVLAHELAHIIFREMVGFSNPAVRLWLEEGVASFHEKRSQNYYLKNYLTQKINQNTFMGLDRLNSFSSLINQNEQTISLFYIESYSLLNYLITEFGKDKFVLFCQHLRDNQDLIRALRYAYSFDSLADLETAWRAYILK